MKAQVALRVYRAALFAYPRSFRVEFAEELVRTVLDQHTFGGRSIARVVAREVPDIALSALRMRGESPVTKFVIILSGLGLSALVALAAGPAALAVVFVATTGVVIGMHGAAPVERSERVRAKRLLGISAATLGAGATIAASSADELSQPWWAAMAALLLAGLITGVSGLARLFGPTRPFPTGTRAGR